METEPNIYFIVPALYPNAGGLTKATYDKASFLAEYLNVEILTTNFQFNFAQVHKDLVSAGKLSPKVAVRNIYNDLSRKDGRLLFTEKLDYEEVLENLDSYYVDRGKGFARLFDRDGTYRHYISYFGDSVHFIDYMKQSNPAELEKRYVFNFGRLISLDIFEDGQKTQQVIYNKRKTPILNIWHREGHAHRVFDLRGNNSVQKNIDGLVTEWLEGVISDKDVVLIDAFFAKTSQYLQNIKCAKIGFIHSHQDYDNDARFSTHFSGFDRFVFLTSLQREAYRGINPEVYEKSVILPHPVVKTKGPSVKQKKIISITRLVANKPVESAVKAFALIADAYPDIEYDIYGVGPDRQKLADLIQELGLSGRVNLKDYTKNPLQKFEEALLSVSLTKFEGYGLSILESLGMSCPVIASRVDYGPSELVKDRVNGRHVSNEDISGIAEAMRDVLDNNQAYQEACLPSIEGNALGEWEMGLLNILNEALESHIS